MAIEIYLEKGYLTNENQSLKIINFVNKQHQSIKNLSKTKYVDLAYQYPFLLNDLVDFLQDESKKHNPATSSIEGIDFGLTVYVINSLKAIADKNRQKRDYLIDTYKDDSYRNDYVRKLKDENEYDDGFLEELTDFRQRCAEENQRYAAQNNPQRVLPMILLMR